MSTPALSKRALNTPPSPIRKLTPLARRTRLAGTRIYHLNIGQPDLKSPQEYFAGLRLYNEEVLAYEDSQGNEALCTAWSRYMNRTLNLQTLPENFLITSGASEALVFTFMVTCDPGDEVIIFDPTYANYLGFAAISGVTLAAIPCRIEENFRLPCKAEIAARISPRTKAILVCSPNNPTGTVYSRAELEMLIEICDERGLFLVVDETYRELIYDGLSPLSILNLAPQNPRVVVIDSLSKRFSLCGARIGCLFSTSEQFRAGALSLAQARLCAPTLEQFAAAHMLDHIGDDYFLAARNEYEQRRNVLFAALAAVPEVYVSKPQGAFYCVARLPVKDAENFASFLLRDFSSDKATTFVAPAAGFYQQEGRGLDKVRVAYVINTTAIQEAVRILSRGLEIYRRHN